MIETIELKNYPDIKRVIQAAFPSYKKHKANVSVFSQEHGTNINSYWDGGSRAEYAIVELSTLTRKSLPTSSHPYFDIAAHGLASHENADVVTDHVGNARLKHLPDGYVLVKAGTLCGKAATAHVMFPASNLPKLLTA